MRAIIVPLGNLDMKIHTYMKIIWKYMKILTIIWKVSQFLKAVGKRTKTLLKNKQKSVKKSFPGKIWKELYFCRTFDCGWPSSDQKFKFLIVFQSWQKFWIFRKFMWNFTKMPIFRKFQIFSKNLDFARYSMVFKANGKLASSL